MEERRINGDSRVQDLQILVARLEEKLLQSDKALEVAREYLKQWQASANEWRGAMNDLRSTYITRAELAAWIMVACALTTLLIKFMWH